MDDIVFVGDMSWDETFTVSHFPDPDEKVSARGLIDGFGGVAANSAVAAVRAGAAVAFMGRVGQDDMSRQADKHMRDHDIRTMLVRADGMLCRVVSIVEPHGEKRLVLYPGVSIYPSRKTYPASLLRAASIFIRPFTGQQVGLSLKWRKRLTSPGRSIWNPRHFPRE